MQKSDFLQRTIEHIDIKRFDARPVIDGYRLMAFQSRNLATAADIFNRMLQDTDCKVILTLAGSLFSAGLKHVVVDMLETNMVDAIVSTGAIMVDQDFFEALGYRHYIGTPFVQDKQLRELYIDRIYDTYIDEEQLQECDLAVAKIADQLPPRPYSSREFIWHMGKYIDNHGLKCERSVIYTAYRLGVPIFVPAFSDCSAGFGLIHHQWHAQGKKVTLDSAADFLELTKIKLAAKDTGLLMIGGGVPKNFTQDVVVATEVLGFDKPMHKYAIQLTVADERDGALSGSTLKEASSWGKVDTVYEQMVFGEATVTMPLLISDAYHRKYWQARAASRFNDLF